MFRMLWSHRPTRSRSAGRGELDATVFQTPRESRTERADGGSSQLLRPASSAARLTDLCEEWFAAILSLREAAAAPEPDALRAKMVQLMTAFKVAARNAAFESADIDAAVFALVAFADAVASKVVGVTWNNRLQFEVYGHRRAGTLFSQELLVRLRADVWKNIQALEVACQCLMLGFEGELAGESAEKQSAFVASVINDIASVRGTALPPLAPEAVRPVRGVGTVGGAIPLAWTVAGFVLALALVWLIVVISVDHHAHSAARGLLELAERAR